MKNQSLPSQFSSLGSFISRHRYAESIIFLIVALAASVGWGEYRRAELQGDISLQSKEFSEKLASMASSTEGLQIAMVQLNAKLDNVINESVALSGAIQSEKDKNAVIQEQVGMVSSTIGSLDKLSKTDPQLLQKYSKVFFLNEHYTPKSLATVAAEFSFNKNTEYQVLASISSKLDSMLRAAKAEGVNLLVCSAYRSYGTQSALKASYKVTYGAGTANAFSADQGYSEHQLGTTLDLATEGGGCAASSFETTNGFTWLVNNAHKYGFTLSYPKGNKYYVYEPWHWRYVGVDLATRLKRDGQYFYDLDQRVIDNYLMLIFD